MLMKINLYIFNFFVFIYYISFVNDFIYNNKYYIKKSYKIYYVINLANKNNDIKSYCT